MISEQILNKVHILKFHPKFVRIRCDLLICCFLLRKWQARMILNNPSLDDAVVHCEILQLSKLHLRCPEMFEGVSEGTPRA